MRTKAWEFYKQSSEGQKLLKLFSLKDSDFDSVKKIFEFVSSTNCQNNPEDECIRYEWLRNNLMLQGFTPNKDFTRESYEHLVGTFEMRMDYYDENGNLYLGNDEKDLIISANKIREKCTLMHLLSLYLYTLNEDFVPILLPLHFYLIQQYADEIGLTIPEIPRARNYFDYLMYYYDICMAAKQFRIEHNMTPAEFCTCLYGFAPIMEEDADPDSSLPQPINVWFTGASKYDYREFLSKDISENVVWACNERTRRGDIIVVYCLSPYSIIHSIWRAESGGFFNPFDHYHCRTTVTKCVKLEKPISYNQFVADSYFSKLPIVSKNLQGINGVELSATSYKELLRLISDNGESTDKFPKLFIPKNWEPIVLDAGEPEKSVEEKIVIKDLLPLLDYKVGDWARQLPQKAGRKEKAIPDFVFFNRGEKHAENAPFVLEVKAYMKGEREIHEAYTQGRSYARMMCAPLFANCDKERLIIYKFDGDSYNYKHPIFENHWSAIFGSDEVASQLKKIIGREVIAETKLLKI